MPLAMTEESACDIVLAARHKARFDFHCLQIGLDSGDGRTWRLRSISSRQTALVMASFDGIPRLWSMGEPTLRRFVANLQKQISSKD